MYPIEFVSIPILTYLITKALISIDVDNCDTLYKLKTANLRKAHEK
jgi:hypothetical protein